MTAAPPTGGAPSTGAAAPVTTDQVVISNFAFSPQVVTVKSGTTVTWTNKDSDSHTVTATTAGAGPASPTLAQGATYRHTFSTPGRFDYLCTIHPFMTGTVVVTP